MNVVQFDLQELQKFGDFRPEITGFCLACFYLKIQTLYYNFYT